MRLRSGISRGNQIKVSSDDKFYKIDTPGWHESVSEVVVSELQMHIVEPRVSFVDYSFTTIDGLDACVCENFLKTGESLVSLYSLIKGYNLPEGGQSLANAVCGILSMDYDLNIYEYLGYMMKLDAIVLNEDRHLRNISIIKKPDGDMSVSPIYDNGMSLLSDWRTYKSIEDATKARSCTFSDNFLTQVSYFDTDLLVIDYCKLVEKLKDVLNNTQQYANENRVYCLKRAVLLLLKRLPETEGILWRRK